MSPTAVLILCVAIMFALIGVSAVIVAFAVRAWLEDAESFFEAAKKADASEIHYRVTASNAPMVSKALRLKFRGTGGRSS